MPLDLTAYSDRDVLRVLGTEQPEFVDIIADKIDAGWPDEQIVRLVAHAGFSGQGMHYAAKICRALRNLPKN